MIASVGVPVLLAAVMLLQLEPSVQGADANGRYSLPPTFTPVPKVGPTNGANYQIYNASTLNL